MKYVNIFFGSIGILIIIFVSFYYYKLPTHLAPTSQQSPATDTLTTYTDTTHHFSLQYPKTLTLQKKFTPFHHLGSDWRTDATGNATGTPLFEIVNYKTEHTTPQGNPYPLFYVTAVRGSVGSDSKNCLSNDGGNSVKEGTVILGGKEWTIFSYSDAGMMQFMRSRNYRTVSNNLCYVLEQVSAGSIYKDETMLPGKSDAELQALFDDNFSIIKTFSFQEKNS